MKISSSSNYRYVVDFINESMKGVARDIQEAVLSKEEYITDMSGLLPNSYTVGGNIWCRLQKEGQFGLESTVQIGMDMIYVVMSRKDGQTKIVLQDVMGNVENLSVEAIQTLKDINDVLVSNGEEVPYQSNILAEMEAEAVLNNMTEQFKATLIDKYLETGEFDKIIKLQQQEN